MWDSAAQQKRHTSWLWTETIEIEKGGHKGEDQERLDHFGLEGETGRLHAD
jgi:hypothetical protein